MQGSVEELKVEMSNSQKTERGWYVIALIRGRQDQEKMIFPEAQCGYQDEDL